MIADYADFTDYTDQILKNNPLIGIISLISEKILKMSIKKDDYTNVS